MAPALWVHCHALPLWLKHDALAPCSCRSVGCPAPACRLKRAGLDYWPFVVVHVHDSWQVGAWCAAGPLTPDRSMLAVSVQAHGASNATSCALYAFQVLMPTSQHHYLTSSCWLHLQAFSRFYAELPAPKRLIGYSKFADDIYSAPNLYRPGDWLMFGAETSGLPQEVTHMRVLNHTAPSLWYVDATADVTACVST